MLKRIRVVAIVLAWTFGLHAASVSAQTPVNQGNGSRTVIDWSMSTAARYAGKTTQVTVTNGAGGTVVTNATTALVNRKAIELQNLGPNAIWCTVDGQTPVATTLGRQIAATGGTWSLDAGPGIVITCIASTAAQVSGAATMVTELR